jgi:hypothetical protein
MSISPDRVREELIKILRHRERDSVDSAEAIRHGWPLRSEPEKPLPDVPLHKRGFGVMDEDVR